MTEFVHLEVFAFIASGAAWATHTVCIRRVRVLLSTVILFLISRNRHARSDEATLLGKATCSVDYVRPTVFTLRSIRRSTLPIRSTKTTYLTTTVHFPGGLTFTLLNWYVNLIFGLS